MGRVALFRSFLVVFKSLISNLTDQGHSHGTKQKFDSVEIWSFPIKFYRVDFVSKLCPW